MDIQTIQQKVINAATQVGKSTLNALYPNEFEVYMVTLELTDSDDNTLKYFTFPINPESISKSEPRVKSIDRTMGSIVVNKTDMFVPQDINIKGNFGRSFKFVARENDAKTLTAALAGFLPNKEEFNHYIKNGYGCFKILQSICDEAERLDNGKPRKLYFYNPALGENYLVEVMSFQANQSVGQNMLWGYDLRLKIISPVMVERSVKEAVISTLASIITSSLLAKVKELIAKMNYAGVFSLNPSQAVANIHLQGSRVVSQLAFHFNQLKNLGQIITDYYSGLLDDGLYPKEVYSNLASVKVLSDNLMGRNSSNRSSFTLFDFEVMDAVEDCLSDCRSIQNMARWQKSSVVDGKFGSKAELVVATKQNQTLESLSKDLGYSNPDINAIEIAVRNGIKETDYDLEGGSIINVSYESENVLKLDSVVDIMVGENLLGKDIQRTLEFKDDDLLTLSPKDTFVQTCEIFTGLAKNSNPEFPNDGFDKSSISNKNLMNCRLSSFLRQFSAVVSKDDTIARFSLANVEMEGDAIRVDMEFESQLSGEIIRSSIYGN